MKGWYSNGGKEKLENGAALALRAGTPAVLAFIVAQMMMINEKLDLLINLLVKR